MIRSVSKRALNEISESKDWMPDSTSWILQAVKSDTQSDKKSFQLLNSKHVQSFLLSSQNSPAVSDLRGMQSESSYTRGLRNSQESRAAIKLPGIQERDSSATKRGNNPPLKGQRSAVGLGHLLDASKIMDSKGSRSPVNRKPEHDSYEKFTPKRSTLIALKMFNKKYTVAQNIIKEYEAKELIKAQNKDMRATPNPEENRRKEKHRIALVSNQMDLKLSLRMLIEAMNQALASVTEKTVLEKTLENALEIAQESRNDELYFTILKLQGKLMLLFNDIYKSLTIFKTLKKMSEFKKYYTRKLVSYKYLGKCFQKIGNHKMAIFYYIKLLQMSWFCDKSVYEILAYDLIGLQYFYMEDLDKAVYYHEKMAEGRIESKNSELRKLGINKLLNKMAEDAHSQKKERKIKSIEQELASHSVPASEDDFELPAPDRRQYRKIENNEGGRDLEGRDKSGSKREIPEYKRVLARRKASAKGNEGIRSGQSLVKLRVPTEKETVSTVLNEEEDTQTLEETEKNLRFLSHLSPNRLIKNFNLKDTKDVVNDYLTKTNVSRGDFVVLDNKSTEYTKRKLLNLRSNFDVALKRILELEKAQEAMEALKQEKKKNIPRSSILSRQIK